MNARRWLAVTVLLLAVAGCSDDPTGPPPSVPLSSLIVTPQRDTLFVGDQATFAAVAHDTDGVLVPSPALTWTSSNTHVFTVSTYAGEGIVRAVGEGSALLAVSSGGKSDTAIVVVVSGQGGWVQQTSSTTFNLNDVFFLSDGNTGWAVGDGGTIMKTTNAGSTWVRQTSSASNSLHGVWFTNGAEGWAVGSGNTVLHTLNAGQNWTRVNVSTTSNFYDVTFTTPDHGWIVGSGGAIVRTEDGGVTWNRTFPTSYILRSVAFRGDDGWVVGDAGTILGTHDGGDTWFIVVPGVTSFNLKAVRFRDATFANAAGDQGLTPRTDAGPDSVVWTIPNAGASYQFEGLSYSSPLTGWAVGYNGIGAIVRTDDGGLTWAPQVSNAQSRLNAVYFIDGFRGWAVGTGGIIVHTSSGGLE